MLYGFMIAVVMIVLALAFAPVIQNRNNNAMNLTTSEGEVNGLDCTNSSISNFNKAACNSVDMTLFLYVGGLIFLAGTVIAAKIIFN